MKYAKLFKELLRINLAQTSAYRGHFIASTINSTAWGALSIITILLLTARVPYVFGWTRNELILLSVVVNVIYGVFRMLFNTNFWQFSRIINRGEFDGVLIKPVDAQFQMSMWRFDFSAILRFLIAVSLTVYLVFALHISVSIPSILFCALLCVASIVMLYSLSFIFLTLTIWFTNLHNLMNLVNTFIGMSRYPKEMYAGVTGGMFFFLLPIIIIISTPTKALLGKADYLDSFFLILFAVIFISISRVFWKFALRFYTSASG